MMVIAAIGEYGLDQCLYTTQVTWSQEALQQICTLQVDPGGTDLEVVKPIITHLFKLLIWDQRNRKSQYLLRYVSHVVQKISH